MMRRRSGRAEVGSFAAILTLSVLALAGFSAGILAGIVWEAPRLVLAHWTGGTTEIAWRGEASAIPAPVAPEPPAAEAAADPPPVLETPPPVAAAPPGRSAVQVGAFAESAMADQLAERLRARGYDVYVTPGASRDAPRWRVRVGPLPDRAQAERVAARLKREEKLPTWVLDEDR